MGEETTAIFGEGAPLPKPERILFKKPFDLTWGKINLCGIDNNGNTCFLNSVVQCLQNLPVWSNYLLKYHIEECEKETDECFFCWLAVITHYMQSSFWKSINLDGLSDILQMISKDFLPGRQQDAHEFLICLLGKMQEIVAPKPVDPYVEMTTAIGQIFGGFLRSQLACQECRTTNNTYEQYFNLSLDIDNVESMNEALKNFFSVDTMEGNAWYACEKCKKHTKAAKRYTIETPPEVLIIQLKRYDMYGNKLKHKVEFPLVFSLQQYMSSSNGDEFYKLYGVVSHIGNHIRAGHYISYISHPSSQSVDWYRIDDEDVRPEGWSNVASVQAYLLFYTKFDIEKALADLD